MTGVDDVDILRFLLNVCFIRGCIVGDTLGCHIKLNI